MKKTIGIIGGGASGLTAAISAARHKNVQVFVVEHQDRAGRKILSTGNGRCNLTNENMKLSCFRSEEPGKIKTVLEHFGYEDTLRFFHGLGLMTKSKNGYVYPRNAQASSVLKILIQEAERLGVRFYTDVHVTGLEMQRERFVIRTEGKTFDADRVILATGGRAAPVLGSDGSGYPLAAGMGHSVVPVVPALVQLKVNTHPFAKAAGVRVDGKVRILSEGRCFSEDEGEILFTAYGLSGIPVFQVSRYAAKLLTEKKKVQAELDLLPDLPEEKLLRYLTEQKKTRSRLPASVYLNGVFPEKLVPGMLGLAGIPVREKAEKISEKNLRRLAHQCRHTKLMLEDTNGFENAQVCAGGVSLKEIDCHTMQSRLAKGLYLTGELLDADGICGGYNLQWAWATGYLAGRNAALSLWNQ